MNTEQIWTKYRTRLKSFLHSKVSSPDDVEDLLQDIMIKVFNRLDTLDDDEKLQSWLFQITHNTIIDFYRKNKATTDLQPEALWFEENDPETLNSLAQCIEPFILSLPSQDAELLMAIDIEGQSQKDYAIEHSLSYSTLKSRVKKGRLALRALFENCCYLTLDAQGNISDYQSKTDNCKKC